MSNVLTESAMICDGYTWAGYIERVPRLHPAVRFTYRQTTPEQRSVILGKVGRAGDVEAERVIAAVIARQVVDWDVTKQGDDSKPVAVPVDAANAGRLQPTLKAKLFNVVTGAVPSDADPDSTEDDPADYAAQLEAALAGETDSQETLDRKN